jgi:hypothetical protein
MNPRNSKQKVTVGVISGFGGIDRLKVDLKEVSCPNVDLMYPHKPGNQHQLKDVIGGNTLWDEQCIRRA